MAKTKEQIFDSKIAPLLEQINNICKHYDIASLYAFQLTKDAVTGQMMSVTGNVTSDTIPQVNVARNILAGKVSVMEVPAQEAVELGLTEGVMTLVKKHAETCPECSMKISAAEATGQALSLADFRHDDEVEASEAQAVVEAVETAPKKRGRKKKEAPVISRVVDEMVEQFRMGGV